MPDRFSIDEYFAEARGREEKPLVPQEQIPALLSRSVSRRTTQTSARRSTAARLIPVFSAAALLVLAVFLLPNGTEPTAKQEQIAHSAPLYRETPAVDQQPEPATAQQPATQKAAAKADNQSVANSSPIALTMALPPNSEATVTALAEAPVSQNMVTLSKEQLATLGITAGDAEVSYTGWTAPRVADVARRLDISVDQLNSLADKGNIDLRNYLSPVKVTVKTNGVGTKAEESPANPKSQAIAPRMVGVYSEGNLLASYWQRSDNELVDMLRRKYGHLRNVGPDSAIVRLVPVHYTIENKRDAYFKKADIVLWFEASQEFIAALPEPYRSALKREMQSVVATGTPGEHFTETWRTSAGAVVETMLYPNPVTTVSGTTTLAYTLDSERYITIALHDIFGREVASFNEGQRQPGSYTAEIPLIGRESGVYLVVLTTNNNERAVRRLLVQR